MLPASTHPIRALIDDMGLAAHPRLQNSWPEARQVLDMLEVKAPDAHQLGRLRRLGSDLLDLRPARQSELMPLFSVHGVDLTGQRTTALDISVTVRRPRLVHVHFGDRRWALRLDEADPPVPPEPLLDALRQRADKAGAAESLVVRVHLDALSGAALEAADAVSWERLLWTEDGPVAHHLVRVVASSPVPRTPENIDKVAFFAQHETTATTAGPERVAVESAWPGRITPGTLHGDLAHIHAHGTAGFVQGLDPGDVSAWAVVVNACQGARSGGHVRRLVRKGRVAHAMGFVDNVTASVTETVARVWHHEVAAAQADLGRSVWRAGVAVRAALGAQPSAWLWRHYTSKRADDL